MNMVSAKSIKITAWLLLGVLVVGPIACSLTFSHLWVHTNLGNGPCLIESLINGLQTTSSNFMAVILGLVMLLMAAVCTETNDLQGQLRMRWPTGFLWRHCFWFLPRNYILLALGQGILHPRVY